MKNYTLTLSGVLAVQSIVFFAMYGLRIFEQIQKPGFCLAFVFLALFITGVLRRIIDRYSAYLK
jgi:hypothetical protein